MNVNDENDPEIHDTMCETLFDKLAQPNLTAELFATKRLTTKIIIQDVLPAR